MGTSQAASGDAVAVAAQFRVMPRQAPALGRPLHSFFSRARRAAGLSLEGASMKRTLVGDLGFESLAVLAARTDSPVPATLAMKAMAVRALSLIHI